jgi:two-component system NtrC family sensor kinase
LAAGISHEISNPLGVILGIASLAQKRVDPESPLREDLRTIELETARCEKIIGGLLDFAKYHEMVIVETDVNTVLDETLAMIRYQSQFKKIRVRTRLATDMPSVQADPNRLKQVFMNLFLNAAHAMPEGGDLTVATALDAGSSAPAVVVRFVDSGKGIAPEDLGRIFEPFFTTGKGSSGTGLGLSISHRIVQQHGGRIDVESAPGKGAVFQVRLPTGPAQAVKQDDAQAAAHR